MTNKPELLVVGPYPDWDFAELEKTYTLRKLWEAPDQTAFLAQHAANIRAIGTRGDLGASAALIAALPQLEIIACNGVGLDAIDLPAAKARGIKVTNTPDVLTDDVADLAIGLCIAIARNIPAGEQHVRSGKWKTGTLPLATRFSGKRMGIIGLGRIGLAIAKRAEAFGMKISYHNRSKRSDVAYAYHSSVEALAADSDFLVAALAGGPSAKNLVGTVAFKALGPEGFFVNVSRGTIADEAALLHALENNIIKGAALDVFLNEPNIDERFFTLHNVVLQPHVGSATLETRKAMGQLVRDNLAAHFAGRALLTPVN
jgi:D-3-phosphoglycerate dehydrogenase